MASKSPFNVAVIGYGLSAKIFHIPFITAVSDTFKLYAIVQRSPKPDNDAEKDHPGIRSFRSVEEMLEHGAGEIDVVIVTTASSSHYSLTKMVLEAGMNVVVEKPFTATHQEAEELVALAKRQNKLLAVYQNRRWDADYVTVSKLIKDGTLGRVVDFETHFDRYRPIVPDGTTSWKYEVLPAGGAVYDLGTHLLDQAVHLFGMPKRVTGFIGAQRANSVPGFDDSFTVLLHYPDSLLVTAKASVISPEENQLRFWVRGEKGSYTKFHLDCQEDQLKEGLRPGDKDYGIETSDKYGFLTTVQGDGSFKKEVLPTAEPPLYSEYYRKLARALAGKGDLPVSGSEASAVIRLIELIIESSKQGKTLDV